MYAVGRLSSYISQGVYTVSAPFHPFGGAVDIIVVEQPDGSYKSSPWYVKFGKFQGVLKTKEKIVNVCINGVEAGFHMYLDHKGEAFFLREVDGEEMDSTIFSPPSSGDEMDEQSRVGRIEKSKSCDFEMKKTNLDDSIDFDRGKIMVRSNSRSRILGLMFGRKSVKGNNKQEEAGGIALQSFNSLERAEIAADLLEVKWSTNLPSETPRNKVSNLSSNNVQAEGSDKSSLVNDYQGTGGSVENSFDHSAINEATVPCNEEMDKSCLSDIGDAKCSNGVNSPDQSVKSEEHDTDECVGTSVLDEKFEVISETSTGNDMLYIGNATLDNSEESETVIRSPSMQNSEVGKHEWGSNSLYEVEGVSEERGRFLSAGVSFEERENVPVYCEPSENSGVEADPNRQGLVTQNLSKEECKEPQVHAEDLCETTAVIAELSSKPEFPALANENNLSDEDSDKFCNTYAALHFVESSAKEDTRDVVLESHSMLDIELVTSESGEAKMSELIHRETIAAHFSDGKNLQRELMEVFENGSQGHGSSSPCITGSTELRLEEPPKASGSCAQIVSNDLVGSEEATDPQDLSRSSSCRKSISLDQEEEYLEEEEDMSNLHNSLGFVDDPQRLSSDYLSTSTVDLSKPPGESLGEDQFQFSDSDDFIINEAHHDDSAFVESLEMENDPSVTMSDIEDSTPSSSMDQRSHLSSIKLERSPNAVEALLEESTNKSSPISIPGSRKCADEEVEWRIESLPIIRSDIDNLEISDVPHPLSHSLDSHSEQLRRELLQKDASNCSTSDLDTKHQLAEDDPTIKDTRIWEEFKNMSLNNAVEISLCKHLLYEGMGADAASQAFDAEKVDPDNCASLGPQLVKNDNLVVRIGGRYFPWDAAATYVSEMLSLGHDQVSEPEGMIAVDRVEKTIEGESPRVNAPSGGSWSLWPFSLRRSSTENSAQAAPNVTDNSNGLNASESTSEAAGNNSSPTVSKLAKQKVKSIVPTSEQLATLNLKEGRNVITFTFSTAMLGKQEVDARVYLWKWNTRIVVSDVDGTITRSDVLGQFMPLVGKDWSHIGVTQLFSAIKENGYQLLFLSARAISQAHLTRQFLFNLKQDGKALPDGPVVISPDGLFPSLFREVIRRAPHEFKIACLQDIRALFPPDCSPFYAGFGNRITDEISYRKLGIPKGKIFIINPRGEVAVNRRFDRKSYTSLHALVDGMFPATTSAEQEDFNQWNYWRMPLPDINS